MSTNNTNPDTTSKSTANGERVRTLRDGLLFVTIWAQPSTKTPGRIFHSVSFERRYQDKSGAWRGTKSLRPHDLQRMAALLQQAHDLIPKREDEPSESTAA
ncbi:MAG: hypothetical protein RLO06_14770 [Parvibaculum sp.]